MDRPEWNKLVKVLKAGDTVVFDSVSRMNRSADEGVDYNRGFTYPYPYALRLPRFHPFRLEIISRNALD